MQWASALRRRESANVCARRTSKKPTRSNGEGTLCSRTVEGMELFPPIWPTPLIRSYCRGTQTKGTDSRNQGNDKPTSSHARERRSVGPMDLMHNDSEAVEPLADVGDGPLDCDHEAEGKVRRRGVGEGGAWRDGQLELWVGRRAEAGSRAATPLAGLAYTGAGGPGAGRRTRTAKKRRVMGGRSSKKREHESERLPCACRLHQSLASASQPLPAPAYRGRISARCRPGLAVPASCGILRS